MLAITHLVVTLLLIHILVLDRNDAFVAIVFGVLIDLDHLMGLKDYADAHGMKALMDWDTLVNPGGHWKSILHNPIAIAFVGPLSTVSRLGIPLLFWGVHMTMDVIQESYLTQFSAAEAMLLLFSTAALIAIRYTAYSMRHWGATLSDYLKAEWLNLRRMATPRHA